MAPLLLACGRPATAEECEEIVERVARLEIEKQRPGRPETIEQEVQEAKERHRQSVHEHCVGKRITERALKCVREAQSAAEVQQCFE